MSFIKIGLVGKRYEDIKLYVDTNIIGETNNCRRVDKSLGGIYNFKQTSIDSDNNVVWKFIEKGTKEAFIIQDTANSKRTSYTQKTKESQIEASLVRSLNMFNWVHFCYLDDLGNIENLRELSIPHSIDFCLNKDRLSYTEYMNNATIIFDSRERKELYKDIQISTPIVLHDEYGCEVIVNGKKKYEEFCTPLKGLSVNGAGDLYAKYFIQKHFIEGGDLEESSTYALRETTEFLKIGNTSEKI